MSKWLEAEEHKKLLRDKEISLRLQREEAVHTHLRQFYDLCHRVNGVRNDSLSIDRLKVECKLSHQTKTDGYQSFHTEDERRGIRISCPNQDETYIDVVIKTHSRSVYWGPDTGDADYGSDKEKVVIRKACALQDLIDWREDQILNAIQWMLLESEVIKDSIPGREIMTEEAVAEAKAKVAEAKAKRLQSDAMALERVRQLKALIADGWKVVGVWVALLVVSMILAIISYDLGIVHWDGGLFTGLFMQLLLIASGIGTIVCIIVIIQEIVKVSSLKSEISSSSEKTIWKLDTIERSETPKNRETGYFLETLRQANELNRVFASPGKIIIGYLKVPVAAVKSIITLPGRISRRSKGK